MGKIKTIELSGSYEERGFEHGKQLKQEIHEFYGNWIKYAQEGPNPPTESELLNYAQLLLPDSKDYAPELIKEIEGISEGAGIAFEKIFFLNCYDEICSYGSDKVTTSFKGCTVFGAAGSATVAEKTMIGQGWDVDSWYPSIIYHSKPTDDDQEIIGYTHPGIVGGAGLNGAGIALVWNSLKATDVRPGVPATFVCRNILRNTTLSDAIGAIINAKRANGMNLMVACPDAAMNVEASAEKYYSTYVRDVFSHANHYEAQYLLSYEAGMPFNCPDTLVRSGRMGQLLEKYKGSIDLEVCKQIMCDHVNYPGSICRHSTATSMAQTQSSIIFCPGDGLMLASNGRPCEAGFDEYRVNIDSAVKKA